MHDSHQSMMRLNEIKFLFEMGGCRRRLLAAALLLIRKRKKNRGMEQEENIGKTTFSANIRKRGNLISITNYG